MSVCLDSEEMAIQAELCYGNLGFPIDNGCGFNDFGFNLQQKQQQMQQKVNQFNQSNLYFDNNNNVFDLLKNKNCDPSIAFSQNLSAQLQKDTLDIDHYVRLQNERLRFMLQEQRKQQIWTLLKKTESHSRMLFAQKDEQIAEATKRTIELEDFVRKMELERQSWQRIAQENEAMAVSLNNALEQMKGSVRCSSNNGLEDAESCCNENRLEETIMAVCKGCNRRTSCILFLPCRHLCSCKDCESFLDSCPVCNSAKKATIEALIFS